MRYIISSTSPLLLIVIQAFSKCRALQQSSYLFIYSFLHELLFCSVLLIILAEFLRYKAGMLEAWNHCYGFWYTIKGIYEYWVEPFIDWVLLPFAIIIWRMDEFLWCLISSVVAATSHCTDGVEKIFLFSLLILYEESYIGNAQLTAPFTAKLEYNWKNNYLW